MRFDNLEFKAVVTKRSSGSPYITLTSKNNSIRMILNVDAVDMGNIICDGYNDIDLLVAGRDVFAFKTKIKPKSKNNKSFTVTGLNGNIDNIPFNKRLYVVMHNDMIVCDLRKSDLD
jgi:hypothetical protein